MANNIDSIVKVSISLESPAVSKESFSTLLLIGSLPAGYADLETQPALVGTYSSIKEVENAGWKEDEEVYKAALVAFSQNPKPEKIMIAPRQVASGDEESFLTTLNRAYDIAGWYGFSCIGITDEEINDIAVWTEATEKMFSFTTLSEELVVTTSDLLRTNGWFTNQTGDYDKFLDVAIVATCFGYAPGSETWALKKLALVNPSVISSTLAAKLDNNCMNYYVTIAGSNVTQTGKVLGNEWIDVIRFRDWLKNDLQLRVFDAFRKNPKLPYTDNGISVIDGCMKAALKSGQTVGGIAEDEYDEDDNLIPGYTTWVPLAANLTAAQKKSRDLSDCKWTARLAGAIQVVAIEGQLGY